MNNVFIYLYDRKIIENFKKQHKEIQVIRKGLLMAIAFRASEYEYTPDKLIRRGDVGVNKKSTWIDWEEKYDKSLKRYVPKFYNEKQNLKRFWKDVFTAEEFTIFGGVENKNNIRTKDNRPMENRS